ncbi:MAG: hypothetical protein FWD47_05755 [Treponema sp.]|nr:hypothetical protein [Treponema sp.]
MKFNPVINHNQSAWRDVSVTWSDDVSQRFYSSVLMELENTLNSLNRASERLESETNNVNSRLSRLENI